VAVILPKAAVGVCVWHGTGEMIFIEYTLFSGEVIKHSAVCQTVVWTLSQYILEASADYISQKRKHFKL
jgi:hypothetical protein